MAQGKQWFIYYRETDEKVAVNKEQYDAFYMYVSRLRHTEQRYGRCVCPQKYNWMCDGDCPGCRFRAVGNMVSLDEANEDGSGVFDNLLDESEQVDEIIANRELINQLFDVLRDLDPDADTIIQLWMEHPEGIPDSVIAQKLGRSHQAFGYQMKKYRSILRTYLGKE